MKNKPKIGDIFTYKEEELYFFGLIYETFIDNYSSDDMIKSYNFTLYRL